MISKEYLAIHILNHWRQHLITERIQSTVN